MRFLRLKAHFPETRFRAGKAASRRGRRHLPDVALGPALRSPTGGAARGGARLAWLLLPPARDRARPREGIAPTASAGDSGHCS